MLSCTALLAVCAPTHADQAITLRSGNGAIGQQDAQVHFHAFGVYGDVTPGAADFTSAQAGPMAAVVNPYGTYIPSLPDDPLALWISVNGSLSGGSVLYAIPFDVEDATIADASLEFDYAVDNAINGIFINGTPISGNSHDGDYHGEYRFLRSDVAGLLIPSATNWLYANVSDYGALEALIFSAKILTHGEPFGKSSIEPAQGGDAGTVSVTVIAPGLQPGAAISLTGMTPVISGVNVKVVNPNILTASFDLTSAALGMRTVHIANLDGSTIDLENAFTVTKGRAPDFTIEKTGTPGVSGHDETFFISVTNHGTNDAVPDPVVEALEPWFQYVGANPAPSSIDAHPLDPPGIASADFLYWNLPSIGPGQSAQIQYTTLLDPYFPPGSDVEGPSCFSGPALNQCVNQVLTCLLVLGPAKGVCSGLQKWEYFLGFYGKVCATATTLCYTYFPFCLMGQHDLGKCGTFTSTVRGSLDPNNLSGPTGRKVQTTGPVESPNRWVSKKATMNYVISFENEKNATKAATNVYVTDTFKGFKFDVPTITLRSISIGDLLTVPLQLPLSVQPVSVDIDLRPAQDLLVRTSATLDAATGEVQVTFLSIDPATGLPPTDPLVGFLQPGAGGSIHLSVEPGHGLQTGASVRNAASIVFDTNPPIPTNSWKNLIYE
jgi:hypothetical protein